MKRKILILLTLTALALSLLPISAMAAGSYTEGCFYYDLGEGCIIIRGYFGRDKEATVPDIIAGYPVSVIGAGAFVGTGVEKLYLPATVMEIEEGAIGEGVQVFYATVADGGAGSDAYTDEGGKTE